MVILRGVGDIWFCGEGGRFHVGLRFAIKGQGFVEQWEFERGVVMEGYGGKFQRRCSEETDIDAVERVHL